MAVLVEAISVIVQAEAVNRKYKGGLPGFAADAPNRTFCTDNEIARVGFMHPNDAGAYVQHLVAQGLVFLDSARSAVDLAVVDQRNGPTTPCTWIDFFRANVPGGTVSAARLKGSNEGRLFCPPGWSMEGSLSKQFIYHPGTEAETHLQFVRRMNDVDVFLDKRTGKELYVGRPAVPSSNADT